MKKYIKIIVFMISFFFLFYLSNIAQANISNYQDLIKSSEDSTWTFDSDSNNGEADKVPDEEGLGELAAQDLEDRPMVLGLIIISFLGWIIDWWLFWNKKKMRKVSLFGGIWLCVFMVFSVIKLNRLPYINSVIFSKVFIVSIINFGIVAVVFAVLLTHFKQLNILHMKRKLNEKSN